VFDCAKSKNCFWQIKINWQKEIYLPLTSLFAGDEYVCGSWQVWTHRSTQKASPKIWHG
jgi:hypothetical protein